MEQDYKNTPTPSRSSRHQKKKKKYFKKFFLLYLIILVVLSALAINYVRKSLVMFEDAQADAYIADFVSKLSSDKEITDEIEQQYFSAAALSKFDDVEACQNTFRSKIQSSEFSYKISPQSYDNTCPIYDVLADAAPFMTVTLKSVNPQTRLGIMTISDWEVQNVVLRSGSIDSGTLPGLGGKFAYTIKAPDNYTVLVNDITLGEDELSGEPQSITDFQYVSEYADMPKIVTYKIEGLAFEPNIAVNDASGNPVEYTVKNGVIDVQPKFEANGEGDRFADEVDALYIAKVWSKLMTDDLSGSSHGVGQVQKYLISGSYLSKMANDWAGSIDITFVSAHILDSFTGDSVSNYIKYTDKCFSCDVYFEKNMTLTRTDEFRTDVFNSRMFFVYVTDEDIAPEGWYLVDMQSIID